MSTFTRIKVMTKEQLREQLMRRSNAERKPSPVPGYWNRTLGCCLPGTHKMGEAVRKAERVARKQRITLAKVW